MIDMCEEIWKPIVDYEGLYEVSNYGRVRSLSRITSGYVECRNGRILKHGVTQKGHELVSLCKDGVSVTAYIVYLVAEAFVPNVKGYERVLHLDGNPHNNHADNLVWYRSYGVFEEQKNNEQE